MRNYVIRRLIVFIPTLFVLSILLYLGLSAGPGDVASYLINPDQPVAQAQKIRAALGLNAPLPKRYWNWLRQFVQGNLGYSMMDGSSIKTLLATRIPRTLTLMGLALTFAIVFGIGLGILSGVRHHSILDNALTFVGLVGISLPEFFVGMLLIVLFSLDVAVFPSGGIGEGHGFLSTLSHLVLPGIALGFRTGSEIMRFARGAIIDALNEDYVTLARSKGLSQARVTLVHGLRTALIPVVTIIMLRFPMLVGGSVMIEQVFNFPGMGTVLITSARSQDFPVVMAVAMLIGIAMLFASLLADIVLAILDPRVRLD